jgi:VanZ family protein
MNCSTALFQRIAFLGAWGLLAYITYSTLTPIQNRPNLPTSTSVEHIIAFFLLGVVFCAAYPRRLRIAVSIVLVSALLLEAFQVLTPDRHGRFQDALEKMAGGLAGVVIGWTILRAAKMWFQCGAAK